MTPSRAGLFADVATDVLGRGRRVRFRARGSSMEPAIGDGDVITVEPVGPNDVRPGDVVVYRAGRRLLAHRLISIESDHDAEPVFALRGDAAGSMNERVESRDVLGRVSAVERRNPVARLLHTARLGAGRFVRRARPHGRAIMSGMRKRFGPGALGLSLLVVGLTAFGARSAGAAPCAFTSNGSGNWTAAVWTAVGTGCTAYPGQTFPGDTVTIANGTDVALDTTVTIAGLVVGQGTNGILRFQGSTARALTVTGNVTVNAGATLRANDGTGPSAATFIVAGSITNNGTIRNGTGARLNVTMNGTAAQAISGTPAQFQVNNLTISNTAAAVSSASTSFSVTGVMTVNNRARFDAGATVVVSGAGRFSLLAGGTLGIGSTAGITAARTASGNIQTTGGRTFAASANYVYNGTANQSVGTGFPTNLTGTLTIDNPGNTVTLGNTRTIASGGRVNIVAGTFAAGSNLRMASTSTINRSGGAMSGTPQGAGVHNVNYTGTSMTTSTELAGSGLNNVTVNLTAGETLTLDQNRAPDGTLAVAAGTLDLSTFTINRSSAGGTLAVSAGATLRLGGTTGGQTGSNFPGNYSTVTLNATSTVEYSSTSAQTVYASPTYGNLRLSGGNTKTPGSSLSVTNAMTVSSADFLQTCSLNLSVGGALTLQSNGTYLNCNATDAGGSGTLRLGGLTVNGGSTFDYVGTGTITLTGNVSNGGTVRINGGSRSGGTPDCAGAQVLMTAGAARTWTGSGSFAVADVNVVQQTVGTPPTSITVYGTLTSGAGSSGWVPAPTPCPSGPANPTAVSFRGFRAQAEAGGGVALRWWTGREVANLGFHVYRDGVRVTEAPVAGSALLAGARTLLTSGHAYGWFDPAGTAASTYTLEDLDLDGTRTTHGPFNVHAPAAQSPAGARAAATRTWQRSELLRELGRSRSRRGRWFQTRPKTDAENAAGTGLAPTLAAAARASGAPAPPALMTVETTQQQAVAAGPAVKLGVQREGWYRVPAAQLMAAGMPPTVSPVTLRLLVGGAEQAIQVSQAEGVVTALEFYGQGVDTPWADTQVYWLTWGGAAGVPVTTDSALGHGDPPPSYPATAIWAPRAVFFPALMNGDAENFFGPAIDPSAPLTQALPVTLVAAEGSGTLHVRMQGVTAGTHVVGVALNGATLGTVVFADQTSGEASFPTTASALTGGATLTLTAQGEGNDVTLVDTVTLTYPRRYVAESDALRCTAPSGQPVLIEGFTTSAVRVWDITVPAAVTALTGTVTPQADGTYSVTVAAPNGGTRTLLAVGDPAQEAPVWVAANAPSSWHAAQAGADEVIVSHGTFIDSLAPLVAQRRAQGLTVAVVDVEDVYDEFNGGVPTPYAVKDFLAAARTAWTTGPRWVLLVGDASSDPRDYQTTGTVTYVPVPVVETAQLETASDDWFGDHDLDGVPEVAIGRLPVQTAAEAAAQVGKIVAYEAAGAAPWKTQALLVSGANDAENDFAGYTSAVQALLPAALTVTEVRGGDPGAQAALVAALNAGTGLVNYIGHGSTQVWSDGLFDGTVARTLTNTFATPLVVAMTCLNGIFHDVWEDCLAESLLEAPDGGAVAVWASSGLAPSAPQAALNTAFIQALYGSGPVTLGEAARMAKAQVPDPDVRKTWILFGDPAMRIR